MNYSEIITVQLEVITPNALSEQVRTYEDAFTIGANIRQATGTISVSAAKETDSIIMFFEVPRTPNTYALSNKGRIKTVDGDVWDLYNVDKYTIRHEDQIRITARLRR